MTDGTGRVQIGSTGAPEGVTVEVTADGPLRVRGVSALVQRFIVADGDGTSIAYQEGQSYETNGTTSLCRCGLSGNKPFCDGSHKNAHQHGVDLTETASMAPSLDTAQEIDGPERSLTDDQKLCAYARFCDKGRQIWNEVQVPGEAAGRAAVEMAHHCPSGRLLVWDNHTRAPIEDAETPTVGLIEDMYMACSGPIELRGGIPVISGNGEPYEVRNRQALCRCGHSGNKPFCDGSHASVKFQDGLPTQPDPNGRRT